jgi:hypothetical protein
MRDWTTMPKVELHLHLEGAIPLDALWELIERVKASSQYLSTLLPAGTSHQGSGFCCLVSGVWP